MKERLRTLLQGILPLVDFDSEYLFSELDSLGITTILMVVSQEYGVELTASDVTPKNFMNLDSIVCLVKSKLPGADENA